MNTGLNSFWARWLAAFLVSGLCLAGVSCIDIRQNVQDLLPDTISKGELPLLSRLGIVNRLVVSVEGSDFQTVSASTMRLGMALTRNALFKTVMYRVPGMDEPDIASRFMKFLPAVAGPDDLEAIEQRLSRERLNEALEEDFMLVNSPAGAVIKDLIRLDPLGLAGIYLAKLGKLRQGSRMEVKDGMFCTPDGTACMLWAETARALTESENAAEVEAALNAALSETLLPGVKVTVVGPLPHTLANSRMVNHDLKLLLALATLAILILFWFFTRDWRSLALVAVPLLSAPGALILTGAFSGWRISGIALGFGVVLIGIAIDFSVHIYMYLQTAGKPVAFQTLLTTPVARSVLMAYSTTAGAFAVLLFSRIPAHRQMALMAIAGLTIALTISFLLVPGMVHAEGNGMKRASNSETLGRKLPCGPVMLMWAAVVVMGGFAWSVAKYNGDIRIFDVRTPEILQAESHFRQMWSADTDQVMLVATGSSLESALDLNDRVGQWLEIHGMTGSRSVSAILPGPARQTENIERWRRFWQERREGFEQDFKKAARTAGFSETAFMPFLSWLDEPPGSIEPHEFMASPAGIMLSGMIRAEAGAEVLVTTLLPGRDVDLSSLGKIKRDLSGVHIFSGSGWKLEMERMMRLDIRRMSTAAILVVSCVAWLFFRNIMMVAASLVPVATALAVMALFTVTTGGDFNMMHLLMGIMVTGLSIDYGIFMVCSVRDGHFSSTAKAVMLCALSTISGFGVLAFSQHPVLKSLGETVLAGIGAALPAAILVTPCILERGSGKLKKRKIDRRPG